MNCYDDAVVKIIHKEIKVVSENQQNTGTTLISQSHSQAFGAFLINVGKYLTRVMQLATMKPIFTVYGK